MHLTPSTVGPAELKDHAAHNVNVMDIGHGPLRQLANIHWAPPFSSS